MKYLIKLQKINHDKILFMGTTLFMVCIYNYRKQNDGLMRKNYMYY